MTCPCTNLPKGVEFRRPWRPEEFIPGCGPKSHDARELPFNVSKLNRPQQASEIAAERPNGRSMFGALFYGDNEKDCGASELSSYHLRNSAHLVWTFLRV